MAPDEADTLLKAEHNQKRCPNGKLIRQINETNAIFEIEDPIGGNGYCIRTDPDT